LEISTLSEPRESDQCFTPEHIFASLGLKFDLDVAAPVGGVDWVPAKRHYSHKDDGLKQPWRGRVWMNPPFSNPKPWVEKFLAHGNGVALLPMSKSKWFFELWSSNAKIVFPPPLPKVCQIWQAARHIHANSAGWVWRDLFASTWPRWSVQVSEWMLPLGLFILSQAVLNVLLILGTRNK
jgi:hypothetical protein